jgi:murein DD-endopeptidase MepM/ murein hydrolase activator NlpD
VIRLRAAAAVVAPLPATASAPADEPASRSAIRPRVAAAVGALIAAMLVPTTAIAAGTGGMFASEPAALASVVCMRSCTAVDLARPGSTLRLRGRSLGDVRSVVFLGKRGPADDVRVRARRVRAHSLLVTVPASAVTGPLRVLDANGTPSPATGIPLSIDTGPALTAGDGVAASVVARKVFFEGRVKPSLTYMVTQAQPADVAIDLVKRDTGETVAHWDVPAVAPRITQAVEWAGTLPDATPAPIGHYEFRVYLAPVGATSRTAQAEPPAAADSFVFLDHAFPVGGKHVLADGAGRFGAARSGYRHEGQDVMAACGTPLVAARAGVVQFRRYHARAGNYVVIQGDGDNLGYVYMHLRTTALVNKGDHVYTGQPIGFVGRTGDASACHLHFELWSAPGWYLGGAAFDPLPDLEQWDALA